MGPGTLFSLSFCHLIWLVCGKQVETGVQRLPNEKPEDLSFLHDEYALVKNTICRPKWTSRGFYCYRYFSTPRTFHEAEEECQSYDAQGHLASVKNELVGEFLAGWLHEAEHDVWIGLHNTDHCKSWAWADGTPFSAQYAPWSDGQPSVCSTFPACVQLTRDSYYNKWNDMQCSSRNGYICQIRVGG